LAEVWALTKGLLGASRIAGLNILAEVGFSYPKAISFAGGQPSETFFDLEYWLSTIPVFQRELAKVRGSDEATAAQQLAQYGYVKGIINSLVAEQLGIDLGVTATPDRVVITSGCQEAMALCLQALCPDPRDVVIARNPTYVGLTGAADCAGIAVAPLDLEGLTFATALRAKAAELAAQGKRPRALYVIADFDNPLGGVLTLEDRAAILEVCAQFKIAVVEDGTYRMFSFDENAPPALATLDKEGSVIFLSTYSKTLCPSIRVGCAVIPVSLFGDVAASRALTVDICMRKGFGTLNTSQLNQAVVGGVLLTERMSLKMLVQPAREHYRRNRDALVKALSSAFTSDEGVSWNYPQGGFFLALDLPFAFGEAQMRRCAADYNVIVMPMTFFSLDGSQSTRVRLAFSNLTTEEIAEGIKRFSAYVRKCVQQNATDAV
jgi:(S)-3,5-dihydroxyphenylglycine transaminase